MTSEPSLVSQSPIRRYFLGFTYGFRGFRHLWSHTDLWPWAAVPAMLMFTLVLAAFALTFTAVPWVMSQLWAWPSGAGLAPGLGRAVWLLLSATLAISLFATSVVALWALSSVVSTPFYDVLAERVEEQILGITRPPTPLATVLVDAGRSIAHTLLALALYAVAVLGTAAIELIPVLGWVVAPIVGAVVTSAFLARELLDTPLARRRLPFATKIGFQWKHLALFQGFGTATMVLLAIPGVNFVSMPAAVVGATLLYCRLEQEGLGVSRPSQ